MKHNSIIKYILVLLLVILIIILFTDMYELKSKMYNIIRPALERKEAFTDLTPAEADTSYSLLKGALPLKEKQLSGYLTSQKCYEGDFQKRLEKTGNYRQLTNNYKRGDPDSCSTPLHEFVNAFYDIKPVP